MNHIEKRKLLVKAFPLVLLAYITLVLWLMLQLQAPPKPPVKPVIDSEFSAQRAFVHVSRIAKQPHPTGSDANTQVRDYLVARLRELGAEVEVQRQLQTYEFTPRRGHARFAYIENVVAHWPGKQDGQSLLLMSHYDSVPYGPGAGDNASGVATILETLRALKPSELPLLNSLTVLFSDGEELGLLGAQSFFAHHRWAKEVGLALNFDSRGSHGPVYMYETSVHNGRLIDALANSIPMPFATSLINSIMHKMPNPTDLSIPIDAGIPSMNFAFIDGFSDYHNATDTPERLSLDSLQHMGSYALPAVRYFGGINLSSLDAPDKHYFNPMAPFFVTYEPLIDWLIALLVILLFGTANWLAWRENKLSIKSILHGIGCASLVLLIPSLSVLILNILIHREVSSLEFAINREFWFITWALWGAGTAIWLSGLVQTGCNWRYSVFLAAAMLGTGIVVNLAWPLILLMMVECALFALLARAPLSKEAWIAGSQWLLTLLALILLIVLGGAAHVLLIPLLAIGLLQVWHWHKGHTKVAPILWMLAGLPAISLLGNTAYIFDLLLGFTLPVVVVFTLLMLLLVFAPLLNRESTLTGLIVASFGLFTMGLIIQSPSWSAHNPQPVSLFVVHDANQNRTFWASSDSELLAWHHSILNNNPALSAVSTFSPYIKEPIWLSPLSHVFVVEPQVEIITDWNEANQIKLRIRPSHAGDTLKVWLPPSTNLQGWNIEGEPLQWMQGDGQTWWSLSGFAVPKSGFELVLDFGPNEHATELLLANEHEGMPSTLDMPTKPEALMRDKYSHSERTIIIRRIKLETQLKR